MKRALLAVLVILCLGVGFLSLLVLPAKSVYLMAVGPTPRDILERLSAHARDKYRLEVTILPDVPVGVGAMDLNRRQIIADKLIGQMRGANPWLTLDPRAILIGITPYDIYWPDRPDWAFVFNFAAGGSAVISTARLDLVYFGAPADSDLAEQRLRKLFVRKIREMVFFHPRNSDPRSILYDNLLGLDDLDRMNEDF